MTVMHKLEPLTANPTDWVVEDIPAGTFRVNRAAMVDEAMFRDEMRLIFDRCWLYVGHVRGSDLVPITTPLMNAGNKLKTGLTLRHEARERRIIAKCETFH
jgi:hypothetical protein